MNKDKTYPYYQYDDRDNIIHYEDSDGGWFKKEFNKNDSIYYYENSKGYWRKSEYDNNDNITHFESIYGRINIGSWINGIRIMINE